MNLTSGKPYRGVNVDHLEVVTNAVNTLRGTGPAATNARKTSCKWGHNLNDAYLSAKGYRNCKTCQSDRNRQRYLPKESKPC